MAGDDISWHARFWEKVEIRGPDDCWPWHGFLSQDGYGRFQRPSDRGYHPDGRRKLNNPGAHRVSYEIANGPIPTGLAVRHKCDHPPCVNPSHLVLGTWGQNNAERKFKGRNILVPPREPWVGVRNFKGGDPVQFIPVSERLLDSIIIHPETECWVWQRGLGAHGYGQISIKGKSLKAHRVAWDVWVGPIPDGMGILHSCDNRACINIQHLRPGTNKDNTSDRYERGRSPVGKDHHWANVPENRYDASGAAHGAAKLTEDAVRLIRAGMNTKEACRRFGVTKATVNKARMGMTWTKHPSPILKLKMGPEPIIGNDGIVMIRRTNMPTREIMRRFKVSISTALRAKGATY